MKPYYGPISGITIYHGDNREIVPLLGMFDAVVTDPPYGMNFDTNSKRFSGGDYGRGEGRNHDKCLGDDTPFDPSMWLQFPKVILWGSNHYAQKLPPGSTLIWLKRHPELYGSFLSDAEIGWMNSGCGVYCYYKQFPPPTRALECGRNPCFPTTPHPNQKPIGLMSWCLSFVPNAKTILDPFMGSGTTLRAAKDLGRIAVGIELEEKYCEIAALRLQQEVLNLNP